MFSVTRLCDGGCGREVDGEVEREDDPVLCDWCQRDAYAVWEARLFGREPWV